MDNNQKPKILIIDSRDCPGLARAFQSKFERHGMAVTLSSDDADTDTKILPLLSGEKFDVIFFFCSQVYIFDDARWDIPTFDWSILGWKRQSINADTPLVAMATAPDDETLDRFRERGVTQVIDRGDKPTAKQVVDVALQQLKVREEVVA